MSPVLSRNTKMNLMWVLMLGGVLHNLMWVPEKTEREREREMNSPERCHSFTTVSREAAEPRREHFQLGIPCIALYSLIRSSTEVQFLYWLERLCPGSPHKAGRRHFHDSQHLKIAAGHCSFVPTSESMKEILIIQLAMDKWSPSTHIWVLAMCLAVCYTLGI